MLNLNNLAKAIVMGGVLAMGIQFFSGNVALVHYYNHGYDRPYRHYAVTTVSDTNNNDSQNTTSYHDNWYNNGNDNGHYQNEHHY